MDIKKIPFSDIKLQKERVLDKQNNSTIKQKKMK